MEEKQETNPRKKRKLVEKSADYQSDNKLEFKTEIQTTLESEIGQNKLEYMQIKPLNANRNGQSFASSSDSAAAAGDVDSSRNVSYKFGYNDDLEYDDGESTYSRTQFEDSECEDDNEDDNKSKSKSKKGTAAAADLGEAEFTFPSVYYDGSTEYVEVDEEWMSHVSMQWMFSLSNEIYLHVASNAFYVYEPDSMCFVNVDELKVEAEADNHSATTSAEAEAAVADDDDDDDDDDGESGDQSKGSTTSSAAAATEEEDDDAFLLLDFERDLEASSSDLKSNLRGKSEREDRHVTRQPLHLDVVSASGSCCYYSAIFDGHGGSTCAEYCASHLSTNIMAAFRQCRQTLIKKLQRYSEKLQRQATTNDLGIAHSLDVESLRKSVQQAFEITNENYMHIAKNKGIADGCTALVVLLYGPDEDGTLKLIVGHAGDCRAVLCRKRRAIRLTEDHKPQNELEKTRIENAGGSVVYMKESWRVVANVKGKVFALSTARSVGDFHLKSPKELVVAAPDLRIVTVDFEQDQFVVLGSDGIWDVVSDQEACDVVLGAIVETHALKPAVDTLTRLAEGRGSTDDKTAVVVLLSPIKNFITSTKTKT